MIAVYILSAVLLILILLLFSTINARITAGENLSLRIGIGRLLFRFLPKKEKKPPRLSKFSQKKYLKVQSDDRKKRKDKEKKADKKDKTEKEEKKKSLSEKLEEIKILVSNIVEIAGKYSKKLKIRIIKFKIIIGSDDASDTAVRYGAVCQSAAYILEFLDSKTTLTAEDGSVDVKADFLSGNTEFCADVTIGVRIIDALKILFAILMMKLKSNIKTK